MVSVMLHLLDEGFEGLPERFFGIHREKWGQFRWSVQCATQSFRRDQLRLDRKLAQVSVGREGLDRQSVQERIDVAIDERGHQDVDGMRLFDARHITTARAAGCLHWRLFFDESWCDEAMARECVGIPVRGGTPSNRGCVPYSHNKPAPRCPRY